MTSYADPSQFSTNRGSSGAINNLVFTGPQPDNWTLNSLVGTTYEMAVVDGGYLFSNLEPTSGFFDGEANTLTNIVMSLWVGGSFAVVHNTEPGINGYFCSQGAAGLGDPNLQFAGFDSGGFNNWTITDGAPSAALTHVLLSVDTSTGLASMAVNGIAIGSTALANGDPIGNNGSWDFSNSQPLTVGDLWIAFPASYVDATDASVIAGFCTPAGNPVFLGNNGELPISGVLPSLYFSLASQSAVATAQPPPTIRAYRVGSSARMRTSSLVPSQCCLFEVGRGIR